MNENLKTTKYRNGDPIPNVNNWKVWDTIKSGAYYNYDSNTSIANTYSRLYNWHAVNDPRNISPAGWHVATYDEWATLIDFLDGDAVAGGKLKEVGTTHWDSPNTGATDAIGFEALPGGLRYGTGAYFGMGALGLFWSADEYDNTYARYFHLSYDIAEIYRYQGFKWHGFAVRCIKD